jgi:hypothetical protein
MIGVKEATKYTFPHTQEPETWQYSHPEGYNQKDLNTNFIFPKQRVYISNSIEVEALFKLGCTY